MNPPNNAQLAAGRLLSLIERIKANCADLNEHELRVVLKVTERMAGHGRKAYGPLDLAKDKRHFGRELVEELVDACAYGAMRLIQEEIKRAEEVTP